MRVAGADVWKGRWVVVVLDEGHFTRAFVAPTIGEALGELADAVAIGIDMPIGLPPAGERRPADLEARAFVGKRRNSVFFTPSEALLTKETLREANQLARDEEWPGISAQAFALKEQILAVQPMAAADERIWEVHPEVSFAEANGGVPLEWAKTSWNGVALRRAILETHHIFLPNDLGQGGTADVADVLDAAIAAWSAGRLAVDRSIPFPEDSQRIGAIWR
jgi:predicted RNase H-like nuclease